MAPVQLEPFLKGESGRNTRGLLRLIILCTIAGAAVASRLFSVISTRNPYDASFTGSNGAEGTYRGAIVAADNCT